MGPITRRHPEMRCALQWIGLIPTISALYSPLHAVQRRDSVPVLVRVEDRTRVGPRNRVVMRDARTGADREVYRSDGDIPFQVALSPDGDRVAFIEVVGPVGARKQRLVVTDLSGRSVRVLGESGLYGERGVRDYTWCCSSAKLAIITGVVGEAVRPVAESLYVVDVQAGAEQFIEGVPRPLQVAWAAFDSSLYIKCAPPPEARGKPGDPASPVYRYHVPSGRLSRTTHRGIFFSPDGNYYFDVRWAEDSGFHREGAPSSRAEARTAARQVSTYRPSCSTCISGPLERGGGCRNRSGHRPIPGRYPRQVEDKRSHGAGRTAERR